MHSNDELFAAYLDWSRNRKGNGALTMYQYECKLQKFARSIAPLSVLEASPEDLDAWVQRINVHGRINAAATQAKDATVLREFYGFLHRKGLIKVDPSTDLMTPRIHNVNPRPISDEQWLDWYEAKHKDPDALLFTGLGYLLGLRRAEICALDTRMVHRDSLTIEGLPRKGGKTDVLDVPFLVEAVALGRPEVLPDAGERFLDAFVARTRAVRGPFFDWTSSYREDLRAQQNHITMAADPQWCYARIRRWARQGFLDTYKPHDLRHAFVTNLLKAGIPSAIVSSLANHSSLAVTSRYAKLGQQDLRREVYQMRRSQGVVEARETRRSPLSRYG